MSKIHTFIKIIVLKSLYSFRSYWSYKTCYLQKAPSIVRFNPRGAVAFITWLINSYTGPFSSNKHFDAEKQILQSIHQAEEFILNGNIQEAKTILNNAIILADDNKAYENLYHLCNLLSSIALNECDFHEAENILVKFTERLLQLGIPETHNSVVTLKLKLARIYHMLGSLEMAEYGFRDCIRVQEKKLENQKHLDEESNSIYLTALFWYGKLLADQQDFNRAQKYYKFCWERILKSTKILPSQKMVVLHSIANVLALLRDFDKALQYLYTAIEICLLEDPNNKDLPMLVVEVGLIFLQKQAYESASFWCQAGNELATHEGNEVAKKEGQKCVQELEKLNIL